MQSFGRYPLTSAIVCLLALSLPHAAAGAATPGPATGGHTTKAVCGNDLLEAGESCDSCPADCRVGKCDPSASKRRFTVSIMAPEGVKPVAVTLRLGYRSSVLSLPEGKEVSKRLSGAPQGAITQIADLGYAARVVMAAAGGLPKSAGVQIDFNTCRGARLPIADDVSCAVEGCATNAGAVQGCSCQVTSP